MLGLNQEQRKELEQERRSNPAVGFGTSFAAGLVIFVLLGRWLDAKYEKEHLFSLIGVGLGLLYGAWELYKMIAFSKEAELNELEESKEDEPPK